MNKLDLLKNSNNKENVIFSPYSLLVALSMLNEGASSYTKEELDRIIDNEGIYKINNIENVLSILNKMYIKNDVDRIINENYKSIINAKYNADIELNSLNDVTPINQYIESNTFGQIKNMLDSINGNLLLINTTAIDMEWPYEIEASSVSKGMFNGIEASYVYGFHKYIASYYKDSEVTALGLELKKYDNNDYECIIIQPDNIELSDYINNMDDDKLNNILNNLKILKEDPREVNIAVPKFSFDYSYDANNAFRKLGLNIDRPDLSGITNINDELNIVHKANIDFSEKGLKAAAATIVEIRCGSALFPGEPLNIMIDKPFIFIIRERNTNTILFMGTVYNPITWEKDKNNYSFE